MGGRSGITHWIYHPLGDRFLYHRTYEHGRSKNKGAKSSIQDSIKATLTNKSLIGIMLDSILLLMTMMLTSSMTVYLFPNYYHSSAALSLMNTIMPIMTIFLVSPVANVFARRFRKKEAAIIGLLIGALTFVILYFVRPGSVYVFLTALLVAYAGLNIFNIIVWAMINDVIDDQEVKSHQRDDGTVYAINSFVRKVGQALVGGIGGYALSYIGHQSATSVQPQDVLDGLYNVTTLAPAIGFLICAAALWFLYPLNRQAVEENQATLAQRRGE